MSVRKLRSLLFRQLQIICSYIARHYVKNSTCAWWRKKYKATKLVGRWQNRIDLKVEVKVFVYDAVAERKKYSS